MKTTLKRLLSCVLLSSTICASHSQTKKENGLWLSDGYGLLIEVSDQGLQAYELTSISCIAGWSAKRAPNQGANEASVFLGHDYYRLSDGTSVDEKRLHVDGNASDIILHRAGGRPPTCSGKSDNSLLSNYAVFWQTYAEQYAFFDLRKIDWKAVDRKFRLEASAARSPEQLFETLRQMIEPLQDAHTDLVAEDIKKHFDGFRTDPNHLEDQDWKKAEEVIRRHYIRGDLRTLCNGHVQFGMLDHSIGYLRIISFYGYVDLETYQQALKALQSALDIFFHDAGHWNGLVIDVRLNQGGDDPLGFEIASRLTDKKYLAYSKVTRNNLDGALHFTAPQESWVVPSDHPGFRGKVVLLTGPDTVSAGETFTMALMGRQPHVVRIGLNTQGVFSDILGRRLPNGWRFHLPNEVYLTKDGKAFDATGVPPDVHLSFFSAEDIRKGDDAAQDAALKVLSK